MKTAIVIPTYNEKSNLQDLVQAIFSLGIEGLEVVVVDDGSPDGTGVVAEEMRCRDPRVHVLHRSEKKGLGTAYLDGFRYALAQGAEQIFEMDADLSHDFAEIPSFLEAIEENDLVVGSRYISGGRTVNWNLARRLVSQWGNIYARIVLWMPIRDLTTGYKCYRRKAVEHLIAQEIDAIGYVFQVETTYRAHQAGFRIKEIPIVFTERRAGKSKFNLDIIRESFWKVLSLRWEHGRKKGSA